jgi:hypothetical protein
MSVLASVDAGAALCGTAASVTGGLDAEAGFDAVVCCAVTLCVALDAVLCEERGDVFGGTGICAVIFGVASFETTGFGAGTLDAATA